MVGTQRAGSIIIPLVVVAQVRLPHGGDVLVHVHLLAQRHHQQDSCNCDRDKERDKENNRGNRENVNKCTAPVVSPECPEDPAVIFESGTATLTPCF